MNDEWKLIIGLALLGGLGYMMYSKVRDENAALEAPLETMPSVALPGASDNVVPMVAPKSPASATPKVPVFQTMGKKVVPITSAKAASSASYAKGVNPLHQDPNEKGASKAYRLSGVNYWLITLPDGRRDYYSDAELSRVPEAKKVV